MKKNNNTELRWVCTCAYFKNANKCSHKPFASERHFRALRYAITVLYHCSCIRSIVFNCVSWAFIFFLRWKCVCESFILHLSIDKQWMMKPCKRQTRDIAWLDFQHSLHRHTYIQIQILLEHWESISFWCGLCVCLPKKKSKTRRASDIRLVIYGWISISSVGRCLSIW